MPASTGVASASGAEESASTPAVTGMKRTADRLVDERAAKRRASRACLSCRSRKVRCDVVTSGMPCTNCKLDDVECTVRESVRGRKPKRLMAMANTDTTSTVVTASTAMPAIRPQPTTPAQAPSVVEDRTLLSSPPAHMVNDTDFLVSLTFEEELNRSDILDESLDDESHDGMDDTRTVQEPQADTIHYEAPVSLVSPNQSQTSHMSRSGHSHISQHSHRSRRSLQSQHSHRSQNVNATHSHSTGCSHAPLNDKYSLPPYIKRLPGHITLRDMEYLAEKDALTIPDTEFRDELLRTYVKIVYCFVPALDLDDFLDPIIHGDDSHPVSLLLFQAVMFASVVFVDDSLLKARGFATRKEARKVFFNRVRILYGLDCEPDKMALIQSLLLMTSWYDSPDDEKDTWYWMGIALSLAQVMGLHRDPETLQISVNAKRLRRRMWWSCFIRDRLLALGIRRPARIRTDEFNVRMLDLADFDLVQPGQERITFVRESGFTCVEEDGRRQMCQICIDLAKLCVCVGNVLQSQYSVVTTNAEAHKNMAVLPKPITETDAKDLAQRDHELDQWYKNQTATSRYVPRSPASASARSGQRKDDWAEDILWLHQALLRMIYLTTLGALHRPRALMRPPSWCKVPDAVSIRKTSLTKVREAAIAMTRLAFDLQSENHLRYLWTSGVPAFLSATQIHLLDINDPDEQVRNMSLGRFYQCFHALCELQDMYTSVDYALRFLENVLKKAGTSIPMLQMLKLCSTRTGGDSPAGSGDNNRRPPLCAASHQGASAIKGGYQPNTMTVVDYSAMSTTPLPPPSASHLNYFSMPVQTVPSQALVTQTYTEFMRALSPDVNMPDHSVTERQDGLLHGDSFGSLSDPSAGAHTLVDSPPSHMDMWNEFDGLLFALPNFDAMDPMDSCSIMPQNHDTGRSSIQGMTSDTATTTTGPVTALTSASAPCAFY